MRIQEVLERAVRLAEPTLPEEQRVARHADRILQLVKQKAKVATPEPAGVFGGSFAKGTWLRGAAEIDVFLKFPADAPDEALEKQGIKVGLTALRAYDPKLRYAEHPYVEAFFDSTRINVVPCFDVEKGKWRSAADRSPYHTEYITKNFDDSLRRETRLLKKFMRGVGTYGAEIAVQGFSGYVCEVITLKFGSFERVLSEASKFRRNQLMSIEHAPEELTSLYDSALVILDPVDTRRNLGAAISNENVAKFILAARKFLSNPNLKFFATRPAGKWPSLRDEQIGNVVALLFEHSKRSVDVLWGQLRRTTTFLEKQMKLNGFRVYRSGVTSDDESQSALLFVLQRTSIPGEEIKMGPDVYRSGDVERFLEKNQSSRLIWVGQDSRLYAMVNRKNTEVTELMQHLIRKEIQGVSPGLRKDLSSTYRILTGKRMSSALRSKAWLMEGVSKLVRTDELLLGTS